MARHTPHPPGMPETGSAHTDIALHRDTPTRSPLSERTALLCAALYTVVYIAPFYLSAALRHTPLQSRNAPAVIQARVRSVALTCLTCTAIAVSVLAACDGARPAEVARLLAVWPVDLGDVVKVFALVLVLFLGPLFEVAVVDGGWRHWSPRAVKQLLWDDWIGYRNIVIAPASEELVFRSCTIAVHLVARVDPVRIVFVTPLVFGFAHVHHLLEFLQSRTAPGKKLPPLQAWVVGLVRTAFQFTYTALFGFFAAFVYLRTGNMWATLAAHSFCNWMGLPRVWGLVGEDESQDAHVTPDVAQGRQPRARGGGGAARMGDRRVLLSVIYYALLLVGAWAFYKLLWPLTRSGNALAAF